MGLIYPVKKWRVQRHGPRFEGLLLYSIGKDLDRIRQWIEEGKLKCLVGQVIQLEDVEDIKKVCGRMHGYRGKGGIGKVVVEVCKDS